VSRNLLIAAWVAAGMALGNFLVCDNIVVAVERSFFQALAAFATAVASYRPSRRVPSVRETLATHGMLSNIAPSRDEIERASRGTVASDFYEEEADHE